MKKPSVLISKMFVIVLISFLFVSCTPSANKPSDNTDENKPAIGSVENLTLETEQFILDEEYLSALEAIDRFLLEDPNNYSAHLLQVQVYSTALSAACRDLNQMIDTEWESGSDTTPLSDSLSQQTNASPTNELDDVFSGPVNTFGNKSANLASIVWPNEGDERGFNMGGFATQGDYLFYANYQDNDALYRTKKDGSNQYKLCDDSVSFINVIGEWVYYIAKNDNNTIYKIKFNGEERIKLTEDSAGYLYVRDDFLYYTNVNENNDLYGINSDGGDITPFGVITNVVFVDDTGIYFSTPDERHLAKIDGVTGEVSDIIKEEWFFNPQQYGDWIYYIGEGDTNPLTLRKIKTDGSEQTDVFKFESKINCYVVLDNSLVLHLRDSDQREYFLRFNLETLQEEGRIYDCPGEGLCFDEEGNTYCTSTSGLYWLSWETQSFEKLNQ